MKYAIFTNTINDIDNYQRQYRTALIIGIVFVLIGFIVGIISYQPQSSGVLIGNCDNYVILIAYEGSFFSVFFRFIFELFALFALIVLLSLHTVANYCKYIVLFFIALRAGMYIHCAFVILNLMSAVMLCIILLLNMLLLSLVIFISVCNIKNMCCIGRCETFYKVLQSNINVLFIMCCWLIAKLTLIFVIVRSITVLI